MLQLDHDEELGRMHGMCGTLEAGLEVQRTIKRAELTAFSCLLKKNIGATKAHVDSKGIIDGLWKRRDEMYLRESKRRGFVFKNVGGTRKKGSKGRSLKSFR